LETIKKLGWAPDIVHCHGWMTSLVPIYVKKAFKDNPLFSDSKVIFSIYDDSFEEMLSLDFAKKIKIDGITNKDLIHYQNPTYNNIIKAAIDFSDAIFLGAPSLNEEIQDYLNQSKKPRLDYIATENYVEAYNEFYDEMIKSIEE
jgi:starch synthase